MKMIKFVCATLAVVLLAGASLPPFFHAIGPHKMSGQVFDVLPLLTKNAPTSFTLDKDQHALYSVALPKGVSVLYVDVRQGDGKRGNIAFNLTCTEKVTSSPTSPTGWIGPGGMSSIGYTNTVGTEAHIAAHASLKLAKPLVLDIHNQGGRCQYWLTLPPATAAEKPLMLVTPLFGSTFPKPMFVGKSISGHLGKNGYSYFVISLKPGNYRSLLALSRADSKSSQLDGSLQIDDEKEFKLWNEEDKPFVRGTSLGVNGLHSSKSPDQDVEKFTRKQGGLFLVTIDNEVLKSAAEDSVPVNFTEKIVPDASPAPAAKQN